jgi:hypothetical protein
MLVWNGGKVDRKDRFTIEKVFIGLKHLYHINSENLLSDMLCSYYVG